MARRSRAINWFPLERLAELDDAIVARLDAPRRSHRRDALACSLGLSGLRSGEVSQLTWGDLSVPLARLRVRTLKGGPERNILLDRSVVQELVNWRGRQRAFEFAKPADGDLLLPSTRGTPVRREAFNRMACKLFDALLGPAHGLTFHSLRHTFAMRVYAESRDLFLTQQLLGHSSVSTTEIYARSLAELPEACRPKLLRGEFQERLRVVPAGA